jgi:hypothetical protein
MTEARTITKVPAARPQAPRPQAPRAEAPRMDAAQTEHIFIESDEAPDPRSAGQTVRERWRLANPLRRQLTEVTLFEEGYLEVAEHVRGRRGEPFRLDLHYLDPIPSISRFVSKRAWWTTTGCAGAALGALALAKVASLGVLAISFALAAGAAALVAAAIALHRSHEKTEFYTLHGRARVFGLVANFGAIKPVRAFVPELSGAIEEAAEKITGETSAYLRAEMREHYRLRGDGVLSAETCAESTGRILAQFDVQL